MKPEIWAAYSSTHGNTRDRAIDKFIELIERNLWWLSLTFMAIGVFWANQSPDFAYTVSNAMEALIDGYSYFAPVAIYLILTPTLIKLMTSETRGKSFAKYTIKWYAMARLIACVYAVFWTVIAFDIPVYSSLEGFKKAVVEAVTSLGYMLTHSEYFYAIYASVATTFIASRFPTMANTLGKGVELIEYLGKFLVPVIPFLLLAVGAYVTILPEILGKVLGSDSSTLMSRQVSIFGFEIDITTSLGMLLLYIVGAFLTGFVSAIWHLGLILLAKRVKPDFSIKEYFTVYWIKVYPLLWATSSEALATPLNLNMVKKFCPSIPDEVRQFVIGTGSFLNINGTLVNVFLMTGLVASILNVDISLVQLLLSIPIVFLIGYGVPGMPGELILFAGPMAHSMGVPPELMPIYLSLYIGLQIGLPDSFRTGANSTDECLCAIILNKKY